MEDVGARVRQCDWWRTILPGLLDHDPSFLTAAAGVDDYISSREAFRMALPGIDDGSKLLWMLEMMDTGN